MDVFYSCDITSGTVTLDPEESRHCVKVLRNRAGDEINVIDGKGTLYRCSLLSAHPDCATATILSTTHNFGTHPYNLTLAVCPTKNPERIEWLTQKATEIGIDTIVPVIGEHSERRVFKTDRLQRILLSAAKQSLKGAIPCCEDARSLVDFIENCPSDAVKLIAYCFEDETHPRRSIRQALDGLPRGENIIALVGPEGDFSREEVELALSRGFIPVHLGESRLRTETAALVIVQAVYMNYMD